MHPEGPFGNSNKYALSLWPRVKRNTEEGIYHIDSIPVEQGERPSVLGGMNYLFSQNDRGAEDNAIFYTFILSCQCLGKNPYQLLKETLEQLMPNMEDEELVQL